MWNTFFADVAPVASTDNFTEAMFADDLDVYKMFSKDVTNEYVYAQLRSCQQRAHQWGQHSRVDFDASKEEFKVLHPFSGDGSVFKLHGNMMDVKLTMATD